jgi:polyferredoxin
MDKVGKPRGLIRYTTENALEKHLTPKEVVAHILRPRIILYTTILVAITVASIWSLAVRVPLKVDVIRDRSILAREADDGRIENVYNLKFMNTTEEPKRYSLSVDGMDGIEIVGDRFVDVASAENHEVTIVVRVPADSGNTGANTIYFDAKALNHEKISVREKASFLMP